MILPTPEGEERRHERALSARPDNASVAELVALLGDASWRVRKAAVASAERFRALPEATQAIAAALGEGENAGLRSACADALTRIGEVAVPELIRGLGTSDVDRRKFVVEVLGEIGTPRARESLIAALDDPDENVRTAVVDALGRMGDAGVVEALRQRLRARAGDVQLTAYVLHALGALGARLGFDELEPYLRQPELARSTYPLLGTCADPRAVERLVQAVATASRGSRVEAVLALARVGELLEPTARELLRQRLVASGAAMAVLEETLDDPRDDVAEAATLVLGQAADPRLAPRLVAAAASRPFVKSAVDALRPLGREVVPPLLAALDSAATDARVLALEIIESYGDESAVPVLLRVATGIEPRAAEAAVSALGKIAGPACLDALMGIVRDGDPEVVRQTALALAAIGMRHPREVATRLRGALEAGDVRAVWVFVIGLIARDEDMPAIVAASHHRDADVRRAALEAFRGFGDRIGEEAVVLALTDEVAAVRAAAARALASYRSERAAQALVVCTADADRLVVAEALRALGQVGGERAAATLLTAAASSSAPVAIAALQGLFRLRPEGLAGAVERALAHADPEVVREGIVVTMRLPPAAALPLLVGALEHRSWHVRLAASEMLANRALPIGEEQVMAHLDGEREPLVRDALSRLLARRGAKHR